jgi:hypothetical protein
MTGWPIRGSPRWSSSGHDAGPLPGAGRWSCRRHRCQRRRLRPYCRPRRAGYRVTGPQRHNGRGEYPSAIAGEDRFHRHGRLASVPGQPTENLDGLWRSRCRDHRGVIGFTNEGRTPCRLAGWPALVAISPAGRATAGRTLVVFGATTLTAPPVVTIKPEARAVAVLTGHGQPAPGMTKCPPAYRQLLVTPPGSAHASLISARIPNFTYLPACYPILVSPVVPASAVPYLRLHNA